MLKLLLVTVTVSVLCYLVYDNYRLKRGYYQKETQVSTIFADDVLSRAEEAFQCRSVFLRYRKLREAHASLESVASLVGGYERLSVLVGVDVAELDATMHRQEKDSLRDLKSLVESGER